MNLPSFILSTSFIILNSISFATTHCSSHCNFTSITSFSILSPRDAAEFRNCKEIFSLKDAGCILKNILISSSFRLELVFRTFSFFSHYWIIEAIWTCSKIPVLFWPIYGHLNLNGFEFVSLRFHLSGETSKKYVLLVRWWIVLLISAFPIWNVLLIVGGLATPN